MVTNDPLCYRHISPDRPMTIRTEHALRVEYAVERFREFQMGLYFCYISISRSHGNILPFGSGVVDGENGFQVCWAVEGSEGIPHFLRSTMPAS